MDSAARNDLKKAESDYYERSTRGISFFGPPFYSQKNACPFGLVRLAFAVAEVIVMEWTP
jgi:hypothetical protein